MLTWLLSIFYWKLYYEYITLNSQGLQQGGTGYGGNDMAHQDALSRAAMVEDISKLPKFGYSSAGPIKNNCGVGRYNHGLNQGNQ